MTTEHHGPVTLHHGDCLDVLRGLPDASVDAVVTDPPYGLANTTPAQVTDTLLRWVAGDRDYVPAGAGFMGKPWDAFVPPVAVWDECYRVLKPGGHVLAFAGSRTFDLMALAVRLAGFEVRDSIAWLYGSGFPKSLDVSKAIDKRGGKPHLAAEVGAAIKAAREARGWSTTQADRHFCRGTTNWTWFEGRKGECRPPTPATFARIVAEWPELANWAEQVAEAEREVIGQGVSGIGTAFGDGEWTSAAAEVHDITAPRTEAARTWQGWGTALKPAFEPVVVARKPLAGTVAANVLAHGTGALNVDACRVGDGTDKDDERWYSWQRGRSVLEESKGMHTPGRVAPRPASPAGRWPANVVLDESQAAALDEQSGKTVSNVRPPTGKDERGTTGRQTFGVNRHDTDPRGHADNGGASRFFYTAKAPTSERVRLDGTAHPTVKPLDLMRWLVRLVTPPDGTVLEPFAGSGTTAEACLLEGFRCIAIEREADYLPLIRQRLNRRRDPVAATRAARAADDDPDLFDLLA